MYNNSADDFLLSGGIPSAKFHTIGTTITGTIAMPPKLEQQTDFDSGKLLSWDDGSPRQQLRVILDTNQRDPEIEDDNGMRALFVKSKLQKAVRDAVRAAGARGLEVGGKLTVTYTADGTPPKAGAHPPKFYSAVYESPNAPALEGLIAPPQAAAPAAPQAYQPAPAAPPAPAPAPAAQPGTLPDHPAFAGMSAEQRAALAQIAPEQRKALGYPA